MTSPYLVNIDAPKNSEGTQDLSDHYPIIITDTNLTIISYNVQLMPTPIIKIRGKTTLEELQKITGEMASYFASKNADVCCVQELFDNTANTLLEQAMLKKGYIAMDRLGNQFISHFNGGARTFIKKELTEQLSTDECIYREKIDYFIGGDATVRKGITRTSFLKNGVNHHVFNTHLQASYLERGHYSEVTLAQCAELRRYIDQQKAQGYIKPGDKIIICGDLNIPLPTEGQPESLLAKKMRCILGPEYTALDYQFNPNGPSYTLSSNNSYNKDIKDEFDVNLDVALSYNMAVKEKELVDIELAEVYGGIQLALSYFVRKHATLFSKWLLSDEKKEDIAVFNECFQELMQKADLIKAKGKNPLDDPDWFNEAALLSKGPESTITALTTLESRNVESVYPVEPARLLPEDDVPLEDLEHCKAKFDLLMFNLRQLHNELHESYIRNPREYEAMFVCSLELNHTLLNKGNKFFKHPTPRTLKEFEHACKSHLHQAQEVFQQESSYFHQIHPIFRSLFAVIAAASIVLAAFVSLTTEKGFLGTFFGPSTHEKMKQISEDFDAIKAPGKKDEASPRK